ncbi:hypothetical protein AC578_4022 [Pseudocercospora eumusae]|uniref:Uncharacterized protein n=1 Tax=Pseudocercospora eumusae TaxID=321146 RepID=A0A139HDZ9_9PEZI|nr:hypothetical protein AC578_4022 [Pseudocercospora eumusae]
MSLPSRPTLPPSAKNIDAFARLNTMLQRLNYDPAKFTITRHVTYHATVYLEPRIQELLGSPNTAQALAKVLRTKLSKGKKASEERTAKEALAQEVVECLEIALAARNNKSIEAETAASGQCGRKRKRMMDADETVSRVGEVREERRADETPVKKRHNAHSRHSYVEQAVHQERGARFNRS